MKVTTLIKRNCEAAVGTQDVQISALLERTRRMQNCAESMNYQAVLPSEPACQSSIKQGSEEEATSSDMRSRGPIVRRPIWGEPSPSVKARTSAKQGYEGSAVIQDSKVPALLRRTRGEQSYAKASRFRAAQLSKLACQSSTKQSS